MPTSSRAFSRWKFLLAALISGAVAVASMPVSTVHDITRSTEKSSSTGYRFKRAENCLMKKVNAVRRRHGLRRFERDKQLAYVARRHANVMAGARTVYHDGDVGWKVTRWERLAQNTGRGRSCKSLSRSFMRSSTHRQNILGRFRFMGFGTKKVGGRVYVQQLFESRENPGNIYNYP